MRHNIKLNKLNKKSSHRKMMLLNLSNSLIKFELIKTTIFKARELRRFIEPIVTISKNFSVFNIRFVFSKLRNLDSVLKLFKILAPRYKFRKGGYLKIFKYGFRSGDNSMLVLIQFI